MKNSGQHRQWSSGARSRSVLAVLASAVVLATAMVATPSAQPQTFTLLYSFQGPPQDGREPRGELIFDNLGNLYGTTHSGGSSTAYGTVFELDTSGKETVLHSFTGGAGDGASPVGKMVRYAGNIYGTTEVGGGTECNSIGCGTVFEVSRSGETVVHTFTGIEGKVPFGGLTRDGSGNLYGTTVEGSSGTPPPACGSLGCGTVFEVSQGQETVLYSFGGTPDGAEPVGSLILDRVGNLCGTTAIGGTFGQGTVFELSPNLDGTWAEHVLYSFTGKSDGAQPSAGLVKDANGNLYGTTRYGGHITRDCTQLGCGVVFKLKQNPDGTWTERVLRRFAGYPADGSYPSGNLVRDKHGNLYGVTSAGGASNDGIVFELDAAGNEKVLHTFIGGPMDGAIPVAGLVMEASGNLYGTTLDGGAGGAGCASCGTVFKITP